MGWADDFPQPFGVALRSGGALSLISASAYTATGAFSSTAPAGTSFARIHTIGAGGSGAPSTTRAGAGGAYAQKFISISPGQVLTGTVGATNSYSLNGDDAFAGNTSVSFNGVVVCLAAGGQGARSTNAIAAGGSATNCIGDIRRSGGDGGKGDSPATPPTLGEGKITYTMDSSYINNSGGSSAGNFGIPDGGNGFYAASSGVYYKAGPGGGGGGGNLNGAGANSNYVGGNGLVIIEWLG